MKAQFPFKGQTTTPAAITKPDWWDRAADLWRARCDTQQIASACGVSEAFVYNCLRQIKSIAHERGRL